jgi:3-dehydroquinate synthase
MVSHVFLIGFMGAGKSSTGPLLAERLKVPFTDLDREIEAREGADIASLFATRGESGFREAEHAALAALAEREPSVVALGGGAVVREDNRALMRELGTVVYLSVSAEEARARLEGVIDRPLLAGRSAADVDALLASRVPLYHAAAHVTVDTDGRAPSQVSELIAAALVADLADPHDDAAIHVSVAAAEERYAILVGPGLLASVGEHVARYATSRQALLVTDERVAELFGDTAAHSLRDADLQVTTLVVPAGERSKSWRQAGELLEAFAAAGADRGCMVVALGGGVVGDLAGFCAASYMRGVALVHVPTTLLAHVDSAIGGKTGVDLSAGKNLAGAFWPPRLVLADTEVLQSLPAAEWTNGLVELVKGALLEGGDTLARVEQSIDALVAREPAVVRRGVWDAAAFKAGVVSADLREADLRECLNFGHTLGHALELLVGYGDLPHGLAVAEGMRFAFALAEALVDASPELTVRGVRLLEAIGAGADASVGVLRPAAARLTPPAVLSAMRADKKSRAGAVRFVLLREPGAWVAQAVSDDVLLEALARWHAGLTEEDS